MTIHVHPVARIRVYEEPNGSFGVDHSGTLGDFMDVPVVEGSLAPPSTDEPMESPGHVQQHIDSYPVEVHMPKRGRLSFEVPLAGLGISTSGQRPQSALGLLLKIALGSETRQTPTTVNDATPSVTSVDLTSVAGITKGCAVGFATGAGGRMEYRVVSNIVGSTVTWKLALSAAPANGSVCYVSASYGLNGGSGDATTSAQFIYEGLEQDDRWLLLGGQIASPPRLILENGGQPRIAFEWQFADWYRADGTDTDGTLTGVALATASYTYTRNLVLKDSELRCHAAASTTLAGTLIDAPQYEVSPNIAYVPHLAPGGVNNVKQWIRSRTAPVISGAFSIPFESDAWYDLKASRDAMALVFQIGSSPTAGGPGAVLLEAPAIQITDVQRLDLGGIAGQRVAWKGTTDATVVSPTANSIHDSAFRVHLF